MRFSRIKLILLVMVVLILSCQPQPGAVATTSSTIIPTSIMLPTVIPTAPQTVSPVTPTTAPVSTTPASGLTVLETLGNPKDGGAALSSDGKFLAVGDGTLVRVWSAESGNEEQVLSGLNGKAYVIVFSPDASLLVLFDNDFVIKLWDLENGLLVSTFGSPGINPMSFSSPYAPLCLFFWFTYF